MRELTPEEVALIQYLLAYMVEQAGGSIEIPHSALEPFHRRPLLISGDAEENSWRVTVGDTQIFGGMA